MNTHHNYSVISKDKHDYLEELFERYGDENNTIFFQDFKEIVYKSKLLDKEKIGKLIDQIGRDMRDKMMSTSESQIKISKKNLINIGKREFFDHLNYLFFENNKINNEKDPELKNLFEILSGEEFTIPRNYLVYVIKEFDLPITIEEFFSPIGLKENLSFSDFCYLFKCNENSDFLIKSFSSGFKNINNPKENLFPITINKTNE